MSIAICSACGCANDRLRTEPIEQMDDDESLRLQPGEDDYELELDLLDQQPIPMEGLE